MKNRFEALPAVAMTPTATRKLLAYETGENGYTLNYMQAKAGTQAPLHSHPHLQVNYMLSGKGVFRAGDERIPLAPGDVLEIGANVPHTFDSVEEDAVWLEFFTPAREDFAPTK